MAVVEISAWQKGCNSVAAIKEIRARAGVALNEALTLVNRVLANEKVKVAVPRQDDAAQLVEELSKVGMTAQIIDVSFAAAPAHSTPSERPANR
jgi:ribosomal protein L7/L12